MKTRKIALSVLVLLAMSSMYAQRSNNENSRPQNNTQKSEVRSNDKKVVESRRDNVRAENPKPAARERIIPEKSSSRTTERELDRKVIEADNRGNQQQGRGDDRQQGKVGNQQQGRNDDRQEQNYGRGDERNDGRAISQNDRREIYQPRDERRDDYRPGSRIVYRPYDERRGNVYVQRRNHSEICPFCFGPRLRSGFTIHYRPNDLAIIETNRLATMLNLSTGQYNRILSINLSYLSGRLGANYRAVERREREIRKVLRWAQIRAYEAYLEDLADVDFCENCSRGWGNGSFRIAFNINL